MILLEIGLWSRVDQLDKGGLMKVRMFKAQEKLLKHTEMRLGFYAGDMFKDAVLGCLTGVLAGDNIVEVFPKVVEKIAASAQALSR